MAHWKKRETVFAEYGIELKMPGAWQLRPQDDPERWLYRSADHKEHLTITRSPMEGQPGEETEILRKAIHRNRRAAELGYARQPELELAPPEYGERVGVPASWYRGSAGESEHQFQALFLCPSEAVWTFFYEGFRIPEATAEEHARWIFDSIAWREYYR